jgi:lipoyl(octanoyl) transferase
MNYRTIFHNIQSIDYLEAWDFQEELLNNIVERRLSSPENNPNSLILCEHPHVYTLGKSGTQNNLLINDEFLSKINATFYKTNRGGDITYHGPGQIVAYPIFNLQLMKLGIRDYVHRIEEVVILTLKDYGIEAERLDGATGVWIDIDIPHATRKICAIGVRVSRLVSMHGLAFNVNTNLDYFNYINPCGFVDKGVTSMQKELGKEVEFEEVKAKMLNNFVKIFNLEIELESKLLNKS